MLIARSLLVLGVLAGVACTPRAMNPSFPVTYPDATAELDRINADPHPLLRPVVVMAGYADPFFMAWDWGPTLREATGGDSFITLSFLGTWTMQGCRARVIEAVQERWPSDDPSYTTEVDVVAHSMGGVVARYAALPTRPSETTLGGGPGPTRRLRIRTLYTIASPHQGARLSALPSLDARVRSMRVGSPFLDYLDAGSPDAGYVLVPYARLGDLTVGEVNTAPPGRTVHWVPNRGLDWAHAAARGDPRITADILRRLRGESPLTTNPPAPLPE